MFNQRGLFYCVLGIDLFPVNVVGVAYKADIDLKLQSLLVKWRQNLPNYGSNGHPLFSDINTSDWSKCDFRNLPH